MSQADNSTIDFSHSDKIRCLFGVHLTFYVSVPSQTKDELNVDCSRQCASSKPVIYQRGFSTNADYMCSELRRVNGSHIFVCFIGSEMQGQVRDCQNFECRIVL